MPETFLFLELLDPEINGLLYCVREIASGSASKTNIHVTLRGPYADQVPLNVIKRAEKSLLKDVLLIANPGMFQSGDEYIIYLSVTHKYLQSVSWKRDFPIKQYGFNPHITLYAGRNIRRAQALLNFMNLEKIELLCSEFRLTTYVRKAQSLFEAPDNLQFIYPKLLNAGRIRVDLLSRLKRYLGSLE